MTDSGTVHVGVLLAALMLGLVVGGFGAWRFVLVGIVGCVAMLAASRFASNETIPGNEDVSWRILWVILAFESAVILAASLTIASGPLRRQTSTLW
jgi:hypothetical protein